MIDYKLINDSIEYYEKLGFARIESPWTVTPQVTAITKPPERTDYTIKEKGKVLVASGEQSFLYLYLKGFLPKGKFQTVTPCFRDEPFDSTHTKYFLKNELIITDNVDNVNLESVVKAAFNFFQRIMPIKPEIIPVEGGSFDIVCEGVELGSYGIRHCDFLSWVYGSGLAEPRTSSLINKLLQ